MIKFVISAVANLLGGPFVKAALEGYQSKLAAGNTSEHIAMELAKRELDVQQRAEELSVERRRMLLGAWWAPENLAGYVMVLYIAKVYLWDASFHLGETDAVRGTVADWGGLIIGFFFAKRGAENVARIVSSIWKR